MPNPVLMQSKMNLQANSSWATASCFISHHPILFSFLMFWLFWIYRSQVFSGDGDQLSRMIEAGIWLVQTELASQAILQLAYRILHPFGWDGLSVINLVSCIAGAVSIWVLLRYNRDFIRITALWAIGLFCSSALIILCAGHTEYYTIFMASLLYYGYTGVGYLRGRFTLLHAALAYSLAVWMHLGILFALPSLLILPYLKRESDYTGLILGLLPTLAAFLLKEFHAILGLHIQGLAPSHNFVPLESVPDERFFYSMFDWGHYMDFLWAWAMRSWIFWPLILWGIFYTGWRSTMRPDRFFLFVYTLCFTIFTFIWHPNLGIHQDWDLFCIEAIPALLLALTYLPEFLRVSFHRYALAVPVIASSAIMYAYILHNAEFERRGYGQIIVDTPVPIESNVTLNGHLKGLRIPAVREGVYALKVIDKTHSEAHNFYVHIAPDTLTRVQLDPPSGAPQNLVDKFQNE